MMGYKAVIVSCLLGLNISTAIPDNFPIEGDCETLLKTFANHTGHFVSCAISNIRPIRMCTQCVQYYVDVLIDHEIILHMSSANETCKAMYIDIDRVEIVEQALNYVTGLWKRSNCDNCFTTDGDGKRHLSNITKSFLDTYDETEGCIDLNNATTVCKNCSEVYQRLNSLYESDKAIYGDSKMCMDIIDSMNRTQNEWSVELKCKKSSRQLEYSLVISCCVVLSLPILFYLGVWRLSHTPPAPVSEQKRLQAWLGRLGLGFGRTNSRTRILSQQE